MKVWFCYLDVRDSRCEKWHKDRARWTPENRKDRPYPAGHDACGYVDIPEQGDKPTFEVVQR